MNLFAFGTYRQFLDNKEKIIPLTPVMDKKLKHLTILTMATQRKTLPYDELMSELDLNNNVRHLEDIIIEAIYAGEQGKIPLSRPAYKTFRFRVDQRQVGSEKPSARD